MTMVFERETWHGYVRRVVAGLPREAVATAAGIHQSGVYRWINRNDGSRPRAENVVQFARGIGESPVEALIAAGYLEPGETEGVIEVYQKLADLSDDELVAELTARLRERPHHDDITPRLTLPDDPR